MDNAEAGSSGVRTISRKKLFEIMQNAGCPTFDEKLEYMENYILEKWNFSEADIPHAKHQISILKSKFKRNWIKTNRTKRTFLKTNEQWLNESISFTVSSNFPGRPQKLFSDLSERSKRRKTEPIRKSTDTDELMYATQMKLRDTGRTAASTILRDLTNNPSDVTLYKKQLPDPISEKCEQLIPFQALCMFVEANLSRRQYEIIRAQNKKFYPCYTLLQRAKKTCYPDIQSFKITEISAEIALQDLLNHTALRLVEYEKDIFENLPQQQFDLELISKWGCDGSKQIEYRQKFSDSSSSDEHIFQSSLVPLLLTSRYNGRDIIWKNPLPSSSRFCRPKRIRFVKETPEITKEEVNYIETQISNLIETKTDNPKNITIKHKLLFTMLDGKVCNSVTDTKATNKCYICGASSKDFNDLSKVYAPRTGTLDFGLSTLHARIRFMEHLLHVAYKLPINKWQAKTEEEKTIGKKQKIKIHDEFKQKTGLNVDVPKQGFGNTNDGNTSRRFFQNTETSSTITGIDRELLHRFNIILQTISSGHKIHTEKFASYTLDTAKHYVNLYPWYPMSPTAHKILIHGAIVIENCLLPIGQLSEEAAEARNKHFRTYRLNFSRKFSRKDCNHDVINRLLLSSDPLISNNKHTSNSSKVSFSQEVIEILVPASPGRPLSIASNLDSTDNSENESEDSFT